MTTPGRLTPITLRVAAVLVGLEGVTLVGVSLVYAGFILVGEPHNRALALFGAGIGLAFGATLVAAGRGLGRRQRPAYSPTLLIELLAVPVGVGLIQGNQPLIAIAVLVPSIAVLALLIGTPGGRSVLQSDE
jgi:hypothetical protein